MGLEILLVRGDDRWRRALELQPHVVAGPPADERLREREEDDEQARADRIELRLELCVDHVTERDKQRGAKHEVGNDAQERERHRNDADDRGEHDPLDAAHVGGDFALRGRIDRLKRPSPKMPW